MNYLNKTAIVTGAASGIGKKIAESLYAKGCNIVACDIQADLLEKNFINYEKEKILLLKTDISKAEDWERVVNETIEKFFHIDFLLNIAGIIEPGFIYETSLDKIDRQIEINLKGTIYGVRFVAPQMIKKKQGHIINISSMAGLAPIPGLNIYSATKFGVRGFSMAAAQELREYNVHVSVICPDAVQTNMLDYQKDKKEAAMTFSAKKYLTVEDLDNAIISIIENPKMELWLPKSRGILATFGSLFPGLTAGIKKKMIQKGVEKQKKY